MNKGKSIYLKKPLFTAEQLHEMAKEFDGPNYKPKPRRPFPPHLVLRPMVQSILSFRPRNDP